MAHDVMISHSSKDKPIADAVCATLESAGIRCWIAPRDILPGREWAESITRAISESQVMVLIFSASANRSGDIIREVNQAIEKGKCIVPFRIENVVPSGSLEYFLSATHWLDALTPPMEAHLQRLVRTIGLLLEEKETSERGMRRPPGSVAPHGAPMAHAWKRRWGAGVVVVLGVALMAVLVVTWMRFRGGAEHGGRAGGGSVLQSGSTKVVEETAQPETELSTAGAPDRTPPSGGGSDVKSAARERMLRALDGYRVGVYFPSSAPHLAETARELRDKLVSQGLKQQQIELYNRDELFFQGVVPPEGFEIRYELGLEDNAAEALQAILAEVYPSRAFSKAAVGAGRTGDFISILLGDEPATPSQTTSSIVKSWAGKWLTSCAGRHAPLQGTLRLVPVGANGLRGTYEHLDSANTIRGTVTVESGSSPGRLVGTWENESGDRGRFVWRLSSDGRLFEGRYSMSRELPSQDSPNWWRGIRASLGHETPSQD